MTTTDNPYCDPECQIGRSAPHTACRPKPPSWAEKCPMSGRTQSVEREEWVEGETGTCLECGHTVAISVRTTDLSPWARVKPHYKNGKRAGGR